MPRILDFAKRLYQQRQHSDDPVRRRFYQIAEKARTDPMACLARQVFEQELRVEGQRFDGMFAACWMGMEMSAEVLGKTCDWNIEDEPLMRSVGITEKSIQGARVDFTLAVLNRLFLRVALDGMAKARDERAPEQTDVPQGQ
jgi:hypothetical protein